MKYLRAIVLAVIAISFSCASASDKEVETKVTQNFKVNGTGWNLVFNTGRPVTIVTYKQNSDIHSFGIYSDDYAGTIHLKFIPFDVEPKQLKKLPKSSKKKMTFYTEKACSKAREKALAGKYKTIATDMLLSRDSKVSSILPNDHITVIGYQESSAYMSHEYFYSIAKDNSAGIYYRTEWDKIKPIDNVPLPFLPSVEDSQVKAVINREKQRIEKKKAAEWDAYYEKQRKAAAEKAAQKKAMEEERMENLKMMDPAYIEVKGWNMNSVGGIAVNITFTNCDRFHSIKYVYFQGYFLNAVSDKCRNSINGSTVWKYTGVGPINPFPSKPGQYGQSYIANYCFDDPLFYAKTAHTFHLSAVTIEYTNGKKKVLTGDELDCRVDYTY